MIYYRAARTGNDLGGNDWSVFVKNDRPNERFLCQIMQKEDAEFVAEVLNRDAAKDPNPGDTIADEEDGGYATFTGSDEKDLRASGILD
jgi:hypothetical protein